MDQYERLLGAAFRFLSYRPRSEKEVREYLQKKLSKGGSDNGVIVSVLERLKELDYVNDKKFALAWLESRQGAKPKGMRVIAQELGQKGVDPEVVATVLSSSEGSLSQKDLARKAAEKKMKALQRFPLIAQKQKLFSFLSRRGFAFDVISRVVDDMSRKE